MLKIKKNRSTKSDKKLLKYFEYLKDNYENVVSIKLTRENYSDNLSDSEKQHITENDLNDYDEFDYSVLNTGMVDLKARAKELIRQEEGE